MDKDGSGQIDTTEFEAATKELGDRKGVKLPGDVTFEAIDADGSGQIDQVEFTAYMNERLPGGPDTLPKVDVETDVNDTAEIAKEVEEGQNSMNQVREELDKSIGDFVDQVDLIADKQETTSTDAETSSMKLKELDEAMEDSVTRVKKQADSMDEKIHESKQAQAKDSAYLDHKVKDELESTLASVTSGELTNGGDLRIWDGVFNIIDEDGGGTIDPAEFAKGAPMANLPSDIKFEDIDTDKSGEIDKDEFNTYMSTKVPDGPDSLANTAQQTPKSDETQ